MFSLVKASLFAALVAVTIANPVDNSSVGNATISASYYKGEATVNPVGNSGTAIGSCGKGIADSGMWVALSNSFMKSQSPSPYCGKKIKVTNTGPTTDKSIGGKGNSVEVYVVDTCAGCAQGHVDLSVAAWKKLTNNAAYSVVGVDWRFL